MLILIILLCVLFALWSWMKPRRSALPPTFPGALPIIGHAHMLIVNALDMWSLEKRFYNFCLQNDDVIDVRIGPQSFYIITDPDDSLTIANLCLEKPYFYGFGKEMFGSGLTTACESVWKPHRKLLNPAFNQQVLQTFVEEFIIQAKSLVAQLSSEVGKGPFDVQPYLINNVMATSCRTTLGLKTDENKVTMQNYAQALEDICVLYLARFQRIWLHLPCIFNWSSYKAKEVSIMKVMIDITKAAIINRKSYLKNCNPDETTDTAGQFKPLLDRMLELADKQDAFTDDEIREHLDTIIGAAFETTSLTLTYCFLLLGSRHDVQERIYSELLDVLGNQDKDLNKNDLSRLVYMEAVIKEALRLFPPAPRIARYSSTDVQLKNYRLPANSVCAISLYGLNRHPSWGADADQFRPERWLDPATLPTNSSTFASFSLGKRNCIGKLYAMISIKITLAYILKRYRIKSDIRKLAMRCDLLLKPVTGHEINLELRT